MLHMTVHNSVCSLKGKPPHKPTLAERFTREYLSKRMKVVRDAAMYKLCNIIFAVLRNQRSFELQQPDFHITSLEMKTA